MAHHTRNLLGREVVREAELETLTAAFDPAPIGGCVFGISLPPCLQRRWEPVDSEER